LLACTENFQLRAEDFQAHSEDVQAHSEDIQAHNEDIQARTKKDTKQRCTKLWALKRPDDKNIHDKNTNDKKKTAQSNSGLLAFTRFPLKKFKYP